MSDDRNRNFSGILLLANSTAVSGVAILAIPVSALTPWCWKVPFSLLSVLSPGLAMLDQRGAWGARLCSGQRDAEAARHRFADRCASAHPALERLEKFGRGGRVARLAR
eukprot:3953601-Pleurochrysis_carterae.AAC.1